jgi:hypothetical protein
MTLYTDGVLAACNSARELYGFERIKTLLTKRPDASTIAETAPAFGQEDDITVLTIMRFPVHYATPRNSDCRGDFCRSRNQLTVIQGGSSAPAQAK